MKNLVSVIVPCYNQAQYLDECLQSVLEQTHQNWECIIVNDGSSDNTEEIAKRWLEKDTRFKYIYQNNAGVCVARNNGISKSLGDYILPLDADDKIANQYIELCLNEFLNNRSLILVYSNARFFGSINQNWNLNTCLNIKEILLSNSIYCSALFKKEIIKNIGNYDDNIKLRNGFEDWEFWIRLFTYYGIKNTFKKIDYYGFYYRRKKESRDVNINNNQKLKAESLNYILIKHIDVYTKHFGCIHEVINQRDIYLNKLIFIEKRYYLFQKIIKIISKIIK